MEKSAAERSAGEGPEGDLKYYNEICRRAVRSPGELGGHRAMLAAAWKSQTSATHRLLSAFHLEFTRLKDQAVGMRSMTSPGG